MVFKTIFTRRARAAFTVLEMLVALGISGLAFAALGSFVLFSGKNFAAMYNYVDMEHAGQNAIDSMTRDIRNCLNVVSYATNAIALRHVDGELLTYSWDAGSKSLVRVKGAEKKVLLTRCDYLGFTVWQRTPISGTWDNYTTATITNAKLVNVSWKCSRTIMGVTMNTESVQTSKIVIRNK